MFLNCTHAQVRYIVIKSHATIDDLNLKSLASKALREKGLEKDYSLHQDVYAGTDVDTKISVFCGSAARV